MSRPSGVLRSRRVVAAGALVGLLLLTAAYARTDGRYASTEFKPPKLLRAGDDFGEVAGSVGDDRMISVVIGIAASDLMRDEGATELILPKNAAGLSSVRTPVVKGKPRPAIRTNIIELFVGGKVRYADYAPRAEKGPTFSDRLSPLERIVLQARRNRRAYPRGVVSVPAGAGAYVVVADDAGETIYLIPERSAGEVLAR